MLLDKGNGGHSKYIALPLLNKLKTKQTKIENNQSKY